ncbi:hypothetical protein HUU05_01660 [candidate division KSB1 bacterium]|nr:hypothetical protein [candidate division KSB1 bacterium]
MRYINAIYTTTLGHPIDNAELLAAYEVHLEKLPLEKTRISELRSFVQYSLVGQRTRYMFAPNLEDAHDFASRATLFQDGVEQALDIFAQQIKPAAEAAKITFDAVLTTTSTGNLMPGISYRLARRLKGLLRANCMMIDLGNVGCTGSTKALNLARALEDSFKNILIVAVELPTTLLDMTSARTDIWQGNCTFGDGAAALWVSNQREQGDMALALEELHYRPQADSGLALIRWDYRRYYTFALADEKTFNNEVRDFVAQALSETAAGWKAEPRWAIHPAGISLLVRLARKLGIPHEALQPSVEHFRKYSNMSSASIMHILKEVAEAAPLHAAINLITMGAGFNVIYGRVRKEA